MCSDCLSVGGGEGGDLPPRDGTLREKGRFVGEGGREKGGKGGCSWGKKIFCVAKLNEKRRNDN